MAVMPIPKSSSPAKVSSDLLEQKRNIKSIEGRRGGVCPRRFCEASPPIILGGSAVPSDPRYWFPAKHYGWGWGLPIAWRGWLVFAAFLAAYPPAGCRSTIPRHHKAARSAPLRRVDLPDDAMDAMASVIGGAGAWGLARLLKKVNQSRCPMRVSVVGREADLAPQR